MNFVAEALVPARKRFKIRDVSSGKYQLKYSKEEAAQP